MPTSKTIPVEPEQHQALKIRAVQENRSLQEVTHDAIEAYLVTPLGKAAKPKQSQGSKKGGATAA
jgi:hypothetical protein